MRGDALEMSGQGLGDTIWKISPRTRVAEDSPGGGTSAIMCRYHWAARGKNDFLPGSPTDLEHAGRQLA